MARLRNKTTGTFASVDDSNVEALESAGWVQVDEAQAEKRKPRTKKE